MSQVQRAATSCELIPRERLDELITVSKLLSEGVSQKDVAKSLGKGKVAITRLKKEAMGLGMLRVTYHPPRLRQLEIRLRVALTTSRIKDVWICARDVGVAAARFYESFVHDQHCLVLDGGITVSRFVAALATANLPPRLTVMPLCADPPSYHVSAYECMTRLATMFPDVMHCEKLPHLLSPELAKDHRRIRRLAKKADAVILGCGPWKAGFTASEFTRNLGLPPKRVRKELARVRSVCGYCALDERHRHVPWKEIDRLMPRALDFEDLCRLAASSSSKVLLLAQSAEKATAVLSAVTAGMANMLVVDESLANALLTLLSGERLTQELP